MSACSFRSNGKLMISGEYFVLAGAKSFSVPLKLGQEMEVTHSGTENISWKTFAPDQNGEIQLFFEAQFKNGTLNVIESNDVSRARFVQKLISQAVKLNKGITDPIDSFSVTCNVEFNMNWGLGSSSTLVANVAKWFNIDPYELLNEVLGGSGYDIACAQSDKPLLYTKHDTPEIQTVKFNPLFIDQLYFVYSGNKVSTHEHIKNHSHLVYEAKDSCNNISEISESLAQTHDIKEFMELCTAHNKIVESTLKIKNNVIEENKSFNGVIKPMGAWGGDFFMAISELDGQYIRSFFEEKDYGPIYKFTDLAML